MLASHRVPSTVLDADRTALHALQNLQDYAAINPDHSKAFLDQLAADLAQAEQEEAQARQAFEQARARAIAAGHRFHDTMLGAKAQVIAQYGSNSTAVRAIGLTRKSERRRPHRRPSARVE